MYELSWYCWYISSCTYCAIVFSLKDTERFNQTCIIFYRSFYIQITFFKQIRTFELHYSSIHSFVDPSFNFFLSFIHSSIIQVIPFIYPLIHHSIYPIHLSILPSFKLFHSFITITQFLLQHYYFIHPPIRHVNQLIIYHLYSYIHPPISISTHQN